MKKMLLKLGTITVSFVPLLTTISCGAKQNENNIEEIKDNPMDAKYYITKNMALDEKIDYISKNIETLIDKKIIILPNGTTLISLLENIKNKNFTQAINLFNTDLNKSHFNNVLLTKDSMQTLINNINITKLLNTNEIQNYKFIDDTVITENFTGLKNDLSICLPLIKFVDNYEFLHDETQPDGRVLSVLEDSDNNVDNIKQSLSIWADSLTDVYAAAKNDEQKKWLPSLATYQIGNKKLWAGVPGTYIQSPHDQGREKQSPDWTSVNELKTFINNISDLETLTGMLLTKNKEQIYINSFFPPEWNGDQPTLFYKGTPTLDYPKATGVLKDDFNNLNALLDENNIDPYRMYMLQSNHWHPHVYAKSAFVETIKALPLDWTIRYDGEVIDSKNVDYTTPYEELEYTGAIDANGYKIHSSSEYANKDNSVSQIDKFLELSPQLNQAINDPINIDLKKFINSYRKNGEKAYIMQGDLANTGFKNKTELEKALKNASTTQELINIFNSFWIESFTY